MTYMYYLINLYVMSARKLFDLICTSQPVALLGITTGYKYCCDALSISRYTKRVCSDCECNLH